MTTACNRAGVELVTCVVESRRAIAAGYVRIGQHNAEFALTRQPIVAICKTRKESKPLIAAASRRRTVVDVDFRIDGYKQNKRDAMRNSEFCRCFASNLVCAIIWFWLPTSGQQAGRTNSCKTIGKISQLTREFMRFAAQL